MAKSKSVKPVKVTSAVVAALSVTDILNACHHMTTEDKDILKAALSPSTQIKELSEIVMQVEELIDETHKLRIKGNKAASSRANKISLSIRKALKAVRAENIRVKNSLEVKKKVSK